MGQESGDLGWDYGDWGWDYEWGEIKEFRVALKGCGVGLKGFGGLRGILGGNLGGLWEGLEEGLRGIGGLGYLGWD